LIGSDPGRVAHGVTLDNWQTAPHLAWTFQHVAEILPTMAISRGAGPVADLPRQEARVTDLPIVSLLGSPPTSVGEVIQNTMTDGWIVMHNGVVLGEHYADGMTPGTRHLLMSVSKSLVGTVAGALVGQGVVEVDRLVTDYVPALSDSGYAGATVRHLLDMRSGIAFSEDYLDSNADVRKLEEAIGWAPRRDPSGPTTMYEFLLTLRRSRAHGGPFEYRSGETDVLGWLLEAAAGARMPELMSELLWSKLGAEFDANIAVDSVGTGMFDGGISAGLRDLARFGQMLLQDGSSMTGQQVMTAAWVHDTFQGDFDSRTAFAASPGDNRMPGGMYRNQFWVPYLDGDVLLCLGIHGQMVYVNRAARLVAAKLSSWPTPQDAVKLFATLRAFDTISAYVHS
jgi:CubicO group peptidase (beta-lactamase class C family)